MRIIHVFCVVALGNLLAACATLPSKPTGGSERSFEADITNDLNISSGEPQIAVDPTNRRNVAIIEFAVGSAEMPAASRNLVMDVRTIEESNASLKHAGRLKLSRDGDNTWTTREPPAVDPDHSVGGGDPMVAYGPDGTL